MARPMESESSAVQSTTANAMAAVSRMAALANRAKRSWTRPPPKYVLRVTPAHSSIAKAINTTAAAAPGR